MLCTVTTEVLRVCSEDNGKPVGRGKAVPGYVGSARRSGLTKCVPHVPRVPCLPRVPHMVRVPRAACAARAAHAERAARSAHAARTARAAPERCDGPTQAHGVSDGWVVMGL